MRTPRPLAAALWTALCLSGSAACFIEPSEPPAFRATCSASSECTDGEECIAGLCQRPCTLASFEDDCPQDGSYIACFNGVCASPCDSSEDPDICPDPHSCIAFDLSGFESGGFQDFAVCGQMCDAAGAPPCPGAEVCLEGVCVDLSGGDTGTDGTGETTGGAW